MLWAVVGGIFTLKNDFEVRYLWKSPNEKSYTWPKIFIKHARLWNGQKKILEQKNMRNVFQVIEVKRYHFFC